MKKMDKEMLEQFQMIIKGMSDMEKRLNQRIDEAENRINIKLENDIKTELKLLGEGQQMVIDKFAKLDQVAEDVEEIKAKVTALEAVTKDNTSQIRELKIAK